MQYHIDQDTYYLQLIPLLHSGCCTSAMIIQTLLILIVINQSTRDVPTRCQHVDCHSYSYIRA
jgi:hypothetical protein